MSVTSLGLYGAPRAFQPTFADKEQAVAIIARAATLVFVRSRPVGATLVRSRPVAVTVVRSRPITVVV